MCIIYVGIAVCMHGTRKILTGENSRSLTVLPLLPDISTLVPTSRLAVIEQAVIPLGPGP